MTTSSKAKRKKASGRAHTHALVQLAGLARVAETQGVETSRVYVEEFVSRLKDVARPQDKILKLSIDKFCLILTDVHDRSLVELAGARVARAYEQPMDLLGSPVHFKVHCGFAVPDRKGARSNVLVRQAEAALRNAQAADLPFHIYDGATHRQDQSDPALVTRIRRGVDRGEFFLHYQPKIHAAYRTVTGAEALARWYDPEVEAVVPPGAFIETAEQDQVIEPLTEQLLRSAISRCSNWESPLGVAVNVTPRLLDTHHFGQVVADALDFYGLAPARLTLEVTERGVLTPNALEHLGEIRSSGVIVSIDDFGTGQCSLSYFRDLPADQIKIDLSFVRAMRSSKRDHAIVRGSIDLAHYCDMEVVAEGVEDEATADLLTEMGADYLQGFHFGRPHDAQTFEERHLKGLHADDEPDVHSPLLRR